MTREQTLLVAALGSERAGTAGDSSPTGLTRLPPNERRRRLGERWGLLAAAGAGTVFSGDRLRPETWPPTVRYERAAVPGGGRGARPQRLPLHPAPPAGLRRRLLGRRREPQAGPRAPAGRAPGTGWGARRWWWSPPSGVDAPPARPARPAPSRTRTAPARPASCATSSASVEVETEADGTACSCSWTPTLRAGRRPSPGPRPRSSPPTSPSGPWPSRRDGTWSRFSYAPPGWARRRCCGGLTLACGGAGAAPCGGPGSWSAARHRLQPLQVGVRVLLVTDSLTPTYGWGRYAIGLVRALRRRAWTSPCSAPGASAPSRTWPPCPQHGEVTSFVSETRRLPRLVAANALPIRRALADCDLVHCITEPYAIPAALVAGRKPLVVTLHGTYAVRPFTRWAGAPLVRAGLPAGGPAAAGEPLHPPAPAAALPHGEDARWCRKGWTWTRFDLPAGDAAASGPGGDGAVPPLGRADQAPQGLPPHGGGLRPRPRPAPGRALPHRGRHDDRVLLDELRARIAALGLAGRRRVPGTGLRRRSCCACTTAAPRCGSCRWTTTSSSRPSAWSTGRPTPAGGPTIGARARGRRTPSRTG